MRRQSDEDFEFIKERRELATALVGSSVLPLFTILPDRRPIIVGSCFLLELGDDILVISAAHVFHSSPIDDGERFLVFGADQGGRAGLAVVQAKGRLAQSSTAPSADDPYDIAAILLDRSVLGDLRPARKVRLREIDPEPRISDVVPNLPGREPFTMYGIMGFPASRRKLTRKSGSYAQVSAAWALPFRLRPAGEILPILPAHLLLEMNFGRVGAVENRPIAAPKPQGMSGGPVWRCTFRHGREPDAKLVGIALEYRREHACVVACRISVAFNLIRCVFPELATRLPAAPSYEPNIFSA